MEEGKRMTLRDPELQAMLRVHNALVALPERARQRVWAFLYDRYVTDLEEKVAELEEDAARSDGDAGAEV